VPKNESKLQHMSMCVYDDIICALLWLRTKDIWSRCLQQSFLTEDLVDNIQFLVLLIFSQSYMANFSVALLSLVPMASHPNVCRLEY